MAVKQAGPDAEEIQAIGQEGVAILKRWLEATTFFDFPYDAYDNAVDCIVPHLAGTKKFDLVGHFTTGKKSFIALESKRYSSTGGQYKEFKEFLRIAYSAALKDVDVLGRVRERHFFWVTFHPFNLEKWSKLESHDHMRDALVEDSKLLAGQSIDEDLLREVSARVTLLVFNPKQEGFSLTKQELLSIRPHLGRE